MEDGFLSFFHFVLGFLTIDFWRFEPDIFYPAAYWLQCGVAFLPIHFLSVLGTVVAGWYPVLTFSSHAEDVGVWDVG